MNEIERQGERTHCLNCQAEIKPFDAYCSACGQKVDDNKLALKAVINEFFENYISLDSRFGRSLFPFLFKPGYLAKQFMVGKRKSFANPFRLYILSSIFFFFCMNSYVNKRQGPAEPIIKVNQIELAPFEGLSTQSYQTLETELPSAVKKDLNEMQDSGFAKAYAGLKPLYKKSIVQSLQKEELMAFGLLADTLLLEKKLNLSVDFDENQSQAKVDFMTREIAKYKDSSHLSNQEVYNIVMEGQNPSLYKEVLFKRLIRLTRADESVLRRFIVGNLSLAMFVLIPLFALVLKLLYRKRNRFYVAHLIHTLYLQAFSFLLFGLFFGLKANFPTISEFSKMLLFVSMLLFLLYFYKSLRKVYSQGRGKTFLKGGFLLASYVGIGLFVVIGEILVSFLIF
ncbi:MAG: DUF3667 domain-containing protein [Vicingaceae bacterium]